MQKDTIYNSEPVDKKKKNKSKTKDINDTTRCKEYQMKNYNINEQTGEREIITHYYQLVIWLNETHQLQEEQGTG